MGKDGEKSLRMEKGGEEKDCRCERMWSGKILMEKFSTGKLSTCLLVGMLCRWENMDREERRRRSLGEVKIYFILFYHCKASKTR